MPREVYRAENIFYSLVKTVTIIIRGERGFLIFFFPFLLSKLAVSGRILIYDRIRRRERRLGYGDFVYTLYGHL